VPTALRSRSLSRTEARGPFVCGDRGVPEGVPGRLQQPAVVRQVPSGPRRDLLVPHARAHGFNGEADIARSTRTPRCDQGAPAAHRARDHMRRRRAVRRGPATGHARSRPVAADTDRWGSTSRVRGRAGGSRGRGPSVRRGRASMPGAVNSSARRAMGAMPGATPRMPPLRAARRGRRTGDRRVARRSGGRSRSWSTGR
jgi:hypothetical protein